MKYILKVSKHGFSVNKDYLKIENRDSVQENIFWKCII